MNKKKGLLIVVSAPSGCGKGTILEAAMKRKEFCYSVSATTRSPRPGETDGVNYFFLDRERFEEMARNGEMLEYAEFVGNLYGTPRAPVEEKLAEGRDVILEIEVQGAMKVKKACPDAVLIFILPPSVDVLRQRLCKRKTESEEVIEERVAQAGREIGEAVNYDYAIVNDDLEKAVEDFLGVIQAEKLTVKRQKDTIDNIINEKQ
ncbi:MAG: guanylate kinase [Oscillospiraceae bacterium]|nr:guanylate kinase [Oscillospiraceae bacterium]